MAVAERDFEIHAPERMTRREHARDTIVTAVLWAFYLYLWLPLASLLAWLLGFELAYDVMVRAGGLRGLQQELAGYVIAVAVIFVVVTAWSLSNRLRFRGSNRRNARTAHVSDADLVQHFDITEAQLGQLRSGSCVQIGFNGTDEASAISVRQGRGPQLCGIEERSNTAGQSR